MEMKQYTPGTFCWTDLATTNTGAAKKFYSELLGIGLKESEASMPYTLLQVKGKDVAGIGELMKEQKEHGVPPHWLSYVSVANADETAKKAASLGGKILMGAFDVMNHGRMAVIQDPTSAVFALWQPKEHIGANYVAEPGAFCWNELMTTNTDAAGGFYTKLFGWTTKVMPMGPMQYTVFENGGKPNAGMMAITPDMGPVPPNWMVYFAVDDCDARAKLAEKLGAKNLVPPTDIPDTGRFAAFKDPQGAAFAIIKLVPM
jgi:predicted enzyme related to lactoylglutathione lyase